MANRVEVVTVDGQRGSVDAADAKQLVESGGRILTPEQVAKERADKLSVVGNSSVDAFVSAADPLGIGGFVGRKINEARFGKESADATDADIEAMKAANPGVSTVGGLVGDATTFAATGGFGGIGAKAGATAGKVALSALGTESAIARALVTGSRLAAQGGVEGALLSGVNSAADGMFRDKELTAEKVLADMGHGALLGVGGGFALGVGGSLLASGAGAVKTSLARLIPQAEEAVTAAATRAEGAATRLENAATKAESGILGEVQNDAAYRALGGTKKDVANVAKRLGSDAPEAASKLGSWLVDRGAIAAGDDAVNTLAKVQELKSTAGGRIGAVFDQVGNVSMKNAIAEEAERIAVKAAKSGDTIEFADAIRKRAGYMNDALGNAGMVADDGTIPLAEIERERRKLGSAAWESGKTSSKKMELERELERSIMSKIEDAVEQNGGKELLAEYKAAKREYQMATLAEGVAEHGAERIRGNNALGLRTSILGAVVTGAAGPVAGIPAALGAQLLQQRGMSTLAAAAGNISRAGVVHGVIQTVDQLVTRAAKGVVVPAKAVATKAAKVDATKVIEAVQTAQANPAGYAARISKQADIIRRTSPEVAQAFESTAMRAGVFLASKIPEPLPSQRLLDPTATGKMSPSDTRKFSLYAQAVNDPKQVLEEFSRGKIVPEKVEALRAVYPSMFQQLQIQVIRNVAEAAQAGKPVEYTQRIRLGLLLDAPTDTSITATGINYRQNLYAVSAQQGNPNSAPAQSAISRPIKVSVTKSTFDRLESDER